MIIPLYTLCMLSLEYLLCVCVCGTKRILAYQRKFVYIPHVCWRYSSTARKPGHLHSLTGSDWIHFTHYVNDGSFTLDGTITLPMTKSYVEQVSSRPHLSSANEGLDCSVTLPHSPTMFQQTRSSRPAAKLKMASGHHPTGSALEADLSPHGPIRSAGTREYR